MARTRYASDPGLIARMGATMFLMGLLFAGFAAGLVFVILYYASHRHGGGGGTFNPAPFIVLAALIGVAALMVRFAFCSELFGGGGRSNNNNNGGNALLIIPVMVLSMVVYAVSFVLIRMLSRYRELSADRSGALLTGRPSALASALVKVTGDMGKIPQKDLRAA